MILVIGDSCVDMFEYGICKRLSPEGPIPVFEPVSMTSNPGMASNAAENLMLLDNVVKLVTNKQLVIKKRFVEKKTNYTLLRVDTSEKKIERVEKMDYIEDLKNCEAVVISDYNKGFLLEEDIEHICKNHNLVFMDTKKRLGNWCRDCNFITHFSQFVSLLSRLVFNSIIFTE